MILLANLFLIFYLLVKSYQFILRKLKSFFSKLIQYLLQIWKYVKVTRSRGIQRINYEKPRPSSTLPKDEFVYTQHLFEKMKESLILERQKNLLLEKKIIVMSKKIKFLSEKLNKSENKTKE